MISWTGAGRRPAERLVLGIESSCDDTGIAILRASDSAVLGQAIANQAGFMTIAFALHALAAAGLHQGFTG